MSQPVVAGLPRVREHRIEQWQLEEQVWEGEERVEGAYPEHGRTQRPLDHRWQPFRGAHTGRGVARVTPDVRFCSAIGFPI